jgi:hypothetical protein
MGQRLFLAAMFLLVAAVAAEEKARSTETGGMPVLVKTGFEEGLKGWRKQGEADFAVDEAERHGGRQSARIAIRPHAPLKYQQLQHDIADARPGDAFRATLWVRTKDISGPPGAYAVLEFLDEGGHRCGIEHSKTGADNGREGWEKLTIAGVAPERTSSLRVALVLHAHGTAWFDDVEVVRTQRAEAWPDLAAAERTITIHTRDIVHPRFGGVGFHVFHHVHPIGKDLLEQVVAKRWRELNPSFARMNDQWDWDKATLDKVAAHLLRLKATGTEIYFATWGPKDTQEGEERIAYAKRVVGNLEYLVREKGATNIKHYCMTNELSLKGWGTLRGDMPKFQDYHQKLFDELQARKLDIKLLASDASPIGWWDTIEWAAKHMDAITGVYGGHHYINRYRPEDERFYPWFLSKMKWGADLARRMGKDFILGEFGCKQDGRTRDGKRMDACIYWGTPQEPLVGIQLCEAAIAAINGGVYAMGNWTFMDFPDDYSATYANKWGTFKWSGGDHATRPHYYAYGLLTKFFRGPATVFRVESSDPRLRVAALQHHGSETVSIAIVNRNKTAAAVAVALDGKPLNAAFRKYVYDPENVPQHPFGDLQSPAAKVAMTKGRLTDTVGSGTLTVYTTAYDEEPPATIKGLTVETTADGQRRLTWQPNTEPDLCYYRIYRSGDAGFTPSLETQIGTTIATDFADKAAGAAARAHYKIIAVDQSGNARE